MRMGFRVQVPKKWDGWILWTHLIHSMISSQQARPLPYRQPTTTKTKRGTHPLKPVFIYANFLHYSYLSSLFELVVVVQRMSAFSIAVTRLNSSQKARSRRRCLLEIAYKQERKKENKHSGTWVRIFFRCPLGLSVQVPER